MKNFSLTLALLVFSISMMWVVIPREVKAYGNGFTYSRAITIDHTKVPNTDQSNFPVLVKGTYDGTSSTPDLRTTGNGGKVQNASGYDVGFYTNTDCSTGELHIPYFYLIISI